MKTSFTVIRSYSVMYITLEIYNLSIIVAGKIVSTFNNIFTISSSRDSFEESFCEKSETTEF